MVRPRKDRIVAYKPEVSYFKPRGIPMVELEEVRLTVDEREAIRLADLIGLSHEEAGRKMGVSRATFGRIIQRARRILAVALEVLWLRLSIEADALLIEQPFPSNRTSATRPFSTLKLIRISSPHSGFTPCSSTSASSSTPKFLGRR